MSKCRDTAKPWERQKDESAQAFEAFSLYLGMGVDRSLRELARKLSKSYTLVSRWSREKKWQERVRAYDNHLVDEEAKRARKEVRDRYTRFGKVSDQLTMTALEIIKAANPKKMTPQDALAFLRVAATLADKNKGVISPVETEETESEDLLGALLTGLLSEEDDDE
jgi:hypothetical protein